ncbi:response regulator transcription factor [Caulobacter sp. UNC279MFTsu5.1]|uniref:response regulator transcription factor n=1 Tax=Caulobacter sp. UNC279MFTsu5.1 TaxID=1502775 RepID=UPI0008EA2AEC|nr:response regulator transcription factor [Caulobacter sp. UNC279MFTsu5.1]SFK16055.1 DNA-binding response regulator, OmpR family, contains REC and winged-helix (wHTH) domain [Caulobacter sp. UNC279MFTsu5.1]
MTRILLIEDEPEMAALVAANLAKAGFLVDRAGSLEEARHILAIAEYGLVLLDRGLPDGDGVKLLPLIRTLQPGTPVIVLTARDELDEKVGGLDAGADDYLTKPFFTDELMARIRAALRRPGAEPAPRIICGRLSFAPDREELFVGDAPLLLKRRELLALKALIRRAGRVVQRHSLLEAVYGLDDEIQPKSLDGHVSRLRKRLAALEAGVVIHPVRNVGYLLRAV